jgi:hypothetical protein
MRRSRSSRPPLAWGLAPMRRVPLGASPQLRPGAARRRRRAPRAGSCAATASSCGRCSGLVHHGDGHLVGAEGALHLLAVHLLGAGPALGRAEHDHRPAGPRGIAARSRACCWMRRISRWPSPAPRPSSGASPGSSPSTNRRLPAAAAEELLELLVADAGEDGGVGDLVAVEVQDGQHRAVGDRVEELVAVPGGGQRAGLRLAVAHHAGGDQVGVVERRRRRGPGNSPARRPRGWSPGVSGATWLGMPPGKENCLKSFCMPSSSRVMLG